MAEVGKTPLLDELENGPWPSFVKEIKRAAEKNEMSKDLLGQLERSYEEKIGHWKHGGIVGVKGYGGGVIGRYSDLPDEFPCANSIPCVMPPPAAGSTRLTRCAPSATFGSATVLALLTCTVLRATLFCSV